MQRPLEESQAADLQSPHSCGWGAAHLESVNMKQEWDPGNLNTCLGHPVQEGSYSIAWPRATTSHFPGAHSPSLVWSPLLR